MKQIINRKFVDSWWKVVFYFTRVEKNNIFTVAMPLVKRLISVKKFTKQISFIYLSIFNHFTSNSILKKSTNNLFYLGKLNYYKQDMLLSRNQVYSASNEAVKNYCDGFLDPKYLQS